MVNEGEGLNKDLWMEGLGGVTEGLNNDDYREQRWDWDE